VNIFDYMYKDFKFDINKPIRLFEAFSGYGSQAIALKRLGVNVEHVGIAEIDKYAIVSYANLHTDFSNVIKKLYLKSKDVIDKKDLPIQELLYNPDFKKLLNSKVALKIANDLCKNYGAIGSFDKLPPDIDICTWSFPCQDISLAGNQKGMVDGSRSNYGFTFLETVENMAYADRPKILLMENVRALFSEKFRDDWREIQLRLENMGYRNYTDILNAKDYGVAQNRERVFIVSIKGDYNYNFPKPIKLDKRLKDYLEDEVDEKYYLSSEKLNIVINKSTQSNIVSNTNPSGRGMNGNVYDVENLSPTLTTNKGEGVKILVKTNNHENFVYKTKEADMPRHRIYDTKSVGFTITTNESQQPMIIDIKSKPNYSAKPNSEIAPTQYAQEHYAITDGVKIRKLTPKECGRFMGLHDNEIYKILTVNSNAQAYKQFGNSIVVDVLEAIFKELLL